MLNENRVYEYLYMLKSLVVNRFAGNAMDMTVQLYARKCFHITAKAIGAWRCRENRVQYQPWGGGGGVIETYDRVHYRYSGLATYRDQLHWSAGQHEDVDVTAALAVRDSQIWKAVAIVLSVFPQLQLPQTMWIAGRWETETGYCIYLDRRRCNGKQRKR